jgi:prepilin-type N-terminal cleavage/methylation domain-containing protein
MVSPEAPASTAISVRGTSDIESRPHCPHRDGFTLIELLVVLVVVGIAASLVAANIGNDDRRDIQREAKRLAGALEHAAALAQWSSETLGVSAEGRCVSFLAARRERPLDGIRRRRGTRRPRAARGPDRSRRRRMPGHLCPPTRSCRFARAAATNPTRSQ